MKAAAPPVDEATIHAGDCLLVVGCEGSMLEVLLKIRDRMRCPSEMRSIFDRARRRYAP
jgi:hypothetical protein